MSDGSDTESYQGSRSARLSMPLLIGGLLIAALTGGLLHQIVREQPRLATAATVFSGVFVQALPFLAFGVVISGLVATFVTPDVIARRLPRRTAPAVLAAGLGGAALPGCECASVPVARRLYGDDGRGAAALTVMPANASPGLSPNSVHAMFIASWGLSSGDVPGLQSVATASRTP